MGVGQLRNRRIVVYRGRFAPSPTGELHLGSAATAIFAAAAAARAEGVFVLRIDDIDGPRVRQGMEAAISSDLAWLGIKFEEGPTQGGGFGPYRESERTRLYDAAIEKLVASGETYLCDCSRADIARSASAPHEGDEGPPYPGTCRPNGMDAREFKRPPALRLKAGLSGASDFVLKRGDGGFSYQLACAVDDLEMQMTEVVRGADLVSSAPRQARIAELLGRVPPKFTHVPLMTSDDGARLAKRAESVSIREHRERGTDPVDLVRAIAAAYGHSVGRTSSPLRDLAESYDPRSFPGHSVRVSDILERLAGGR